MKDSRRFPLSLIGIIVTGTLLLSGCITMRSEIAINADGSGTQSIILAMDESMMALANQGDQSNQDSGAQSKDPLADAQSQFKALSDKVPGASFEPYTDPTGKSGFKVVLPFQSLDELTELQASDNPSDNMDQITFTRNGSVVTLNLDVNTGDLAAKASGEQATATKTPQEAAMQAQMMAAMGMDISYAIALPGKILDWSPKDNVTYDAAANKLSWAADLSKPLNITVKWDNAQKPAHISAASDSAPVKADAASTATDLAPTSGDDDMAARSTASTGAAATMETLTQYTESMMSLDQAALAAIATDQAIDHPLRQKLPGMFSADDLSMVYITTFADANMGAAEWQAQWTQDGDGRSLSGVDVLTFDAEGKITSITTYVEPTEFSTLGTN